MRRLLISFFVMSSCGLAPFEPALDERASTRQALDAVTGFGANPGNLLMFRFVPAGLPANRPLVVLLHGCGDTAANFSTGSGLEAQATARRFALLVPQQQTSNNFAGCFNWFDSSNQARSSGELASIVQMIDRMVSDVGSDPQQVFVVGFSAGAAETSNLLAAHPDRFRAAAIVAGVPYKCTDTLAGAQGCLDGVDQPPATWGMRVRAAFPGFTGARPRVAVWHGLMDTTVAPLNRLELVQQWTDVAGIDQVADGTATITSGGTRTFFRASATGTPLVELNEVPGLGHVWRTAWATDLADFFGLSAGSGGGAAGGGSAGGGAAGGSAAGGAAGGGAAAGGAAAGGAAAGGAAAGGAAAGGAAAGGSAGSGSVGGGSAGSGSVGGGSSGGPNAGGTAQGGGSGTVTTPSSCGSCSTGSGLFLLAGIPLLLGRRRRVAGRLTA